MSRSPITVRDAVVDDAAFLAGLWADSLRRADAEGQVGDVLDVIAGAQADPERRLVVAEFEGRLAGAVLLAVAPVSALNPERMVSMVAPHVLPSFRRHGVGRVLIEAAATFAEEREVALVAAAVPSGSREGNRFLARLGLSAHAVQRVGATVALRAKLGSRAPSVTLQTARPSLQVLAARRQQRRHRATAV